MPEEGANLIDEDKASNVVAATLFRTLIHCAANTHTASGVHTSAVVAALVHNYVEKLAFRPQIRMYEGMVHIYRR
jgi:hypothetical protein